MGSQQIQKGLDADKARFNTYPVTFIDFRLHSPANQKSTMQLAFNIQREGKPVHYGIFKPQVKNERELRQVFRDYVSTMAETNYAPALITPENQEQYYEANVKELVEDYRTLAAKAPTRMLKWFKHEVKSEQLRQANMEYRAADNLQQERIYPVRSADDAEWLLRKVRRFLDTYRAYKEDPVVFFPDTFRITNDGLRSAVTLFDSREGHKQKHSFFLEFSEEKTSQLMAEMLNRQFAMHQVTSWMPRLPETVGEEVPPRGQQYLTFSAGFTEAFRRNGAPAAPALHTAKTEEILPSHPQRPRGRVKAPVSGYEQPVQLPRQHGGTHRSDYGWGQDGR